MKAQRWVIRVGLGLLASVGIGLGVAEAAGISPVDSTTRLPVASTVTVSISQGGLNVTNTWLPEPGQTVTIGVNVDGVPVSATIVLVCPDGTTGTPCPTSLAAVNPITAGVLRTSAYPGVCTNSGLSTDFSADFTFNPVTNELTATDCGGMAVIQVSGTGVAGEPFIFVLPGDSDFDGIPDIYEAQFCPGTSPNCLVKDADNDTGAGAPIGDGITSFDEYRGFMVSLKHVRTDPTQKDLFLHVVNPADSVGGVPVVSTTCGTSCLGGGTITYPTPTVPNATLTLPATAGTPGAVGTFTTSVPVFGTAHVRGEIIGANAAGRARVVAVTSSTSVTAEVTVAFPGTTPLSAGQWQLSESLFASVYSLVAPERVHLLGYAPGATSLLTTEWVDSFVSLVPAQTLTVTPTDLPDRTVNANRLYGTAVQRGVRVMEGLNTASTSVLGWSYGVASPNTAGNVIVFTQRILNYLNGLIDDGAGALVRYSTFVNGAWTTPTLVGDGQPGNPGSDVRNFILSKAMQFYVGMEVGHSLDLTPTVMESNKTTYGYHYAPFTGDCLDQGITIKVKSGFNTFYIPSLCSSTDLSQFLISP